LGGPPAVLAGAARPRGVERRQPLQDGGIGQVRGPAVGGEHRRVQPGVRLGRPGRAG
jgi:hypothetical protein